MRATSLLGPVLVVVATLTAGATARGESKEGQWRYYGGDAGSSKYSPLDQINKDNAGKVEVAWSWESPDVPMQKANRQLSSFAFEITPIMVNGTLYTSTSLAQVVAIDAKTGKQLWVFDPQGYKAGRPTNLGFVHRGVAYWTDGMQERLYVAAHDATLWAIDAKTGTAVSEFGDDGKVDLAKNIPPRRAGPQFHHDFAAGDLPRRGGGGLFDFRRTAVQGSAAGRRAGL